LNPSKFEPLSSWIHKVRDEEVGHILHLRDYQPSSHTKFGVATQSNEEGTFYLCSCIIKYEGLESADSSELFLVVNFQL
jgi:hypothetical protein